MGDQGRLYVNDDVVPAYKKTIHHADLILPNQFEAESVHPILVLYLTNAHQSNLSQSSVRRQDYLFIHISRGHHRHPPHLLRSPRHHHFSAIIEVVPVRLHSKPTRELPHSHRLHDPI